VTFNNLALFQGAARQLLVGRPFLVGGTKNTMRAAPLLLLLLVACAGPAQPSRIIAVQTAQDHWNSIPLLEGKTTFFLTPTGEPVTVHNDQWELPNPLPPELATGSVTARSGDFQQVFTFENAEPLVVQLLPLSVNAAPAPVVTNAEALAGAVVDQLPFNHAEIRILGPVSVSVTGDFWRGVLAEAARHDVPGVVTVAVVERPAGERFHGFARGGVAAVSTRTGKVSHELFLHEVAHAFGARHAPGCGTAGVDRSFPNAEGRVDGDFLFSARAGHLVLGEVFDLMTYCHPRRAGVFTTIQVLRGMKR